MRRLALQSDELREIAQARLVDEAEVALAPPGYNLKIQHMPTSRPHKNFKFQLLRCRQGDG